MNVVILVWKLMKHNSFQKSGQNFDDNFDPKCRMPHMKDGWTNYNIGKTSFY